MGRTSNPVQYLDFVDNISLLGIIENIPIVWDPPLRAKFFFLLSSITPYFRLPTLPTFRWPPKKLRATEATKLFICCFGDIIKHNCEKIRNIAPTLTYPPSGEPLLLVYTQYKASRSHCLLYLWSIQGNWDQFIWYIVDMGKPENQGKINKRKKIKYVWNGFVDNHEDASVWCLQKKPNKCHCL